MSVQVDIGGDNGTQHSLVERFLREAYDARPEFYDVALSYTIERGFIMIHARRTFAPTTAYTPGDRLEMPSTEDVSDEVRSTLEQGGIVVVKA